MRLYASILIALGLSTAACGKKAEPQKAAEPTQVDKGTAEKPAEKPAEKVAEKPAEKPADPTTAEKPAEKPADQANADKPAEKPATPADHAAGVNAAFEALSSGKVAEAYANFADDVTYTVVGAPEPIKGKDAIVKFQTESLAAFPDAKFKASKIIDAADATVVLYVMQGTNSTEIMGKPATNKKVSVGGALVLKFNADGKVASAENYMDSIALLEQLGLAPGQKPDAPVTSAAWPETTEVVKADAVAANVDFVKALVGKIKADQIDAALADFADDFSMADPDGAPAVTGKEATAAAFKAMFTAMADFASTADEVITAGEWVVSKQTTTYTYKGGIEGVEAKDQKVTQHELGVGHIVNGKLASWTSYENQMEAYLALGALGGATEKPADGAAPAAAGELPKFGVASCDAYLTHVQECLGTMPESARGPVEGVIKQAVEGWQKLAAGGDGAKDALEQGCKASLEGAKKAMGAVCPTVKWE